jgi:hypothetical protein
MVSSRFWFQTSSNHRRASMTVDVDMGIPSSLANHENVNPPPDQIVGREFQQATQDEFPIIGSLQQHLIPIQNLPAYAF